MSRFRKAWQSLNFDTEYLFGFETLVFVTSGILSMHSHLVTLQRGRKLGIASYDPFKSINPFCSDQTEQNKKNLFALTYTL